MARLALVINPALYGNLPFDPAKDFAPVSKVVDAVNILVVNVISPEQFAAFIKSEIAKWGKVVKYSGAKAN